jgi:DNA (cytosine-5)-methyltransferase 1
MAVAYGISAYESNAMKSSNPHSGVYEADTSRTLDLNGGNPACNQGGIVIVDTIGGQSESAVESDVAPTLKATHYKMPPCVALGVDAYNQSLTGDKAKTLNSAASDADHVPCVIETAGFCPETGGNDPSRSISYSPERSPTLRTGATPGVVYAVENHPADSRVDIDESGTVQTLTSRMGTGGGNVPMVMEPFCKSARGRFKGDAETWVPAKVANTINTFDQGEARANELVVETIPLEGNGQRPSHRGDGYAETDKSYTLNATEVHGVAYSFDPGASRDVGVLFIEECGKTLTNGTCPGHHDGVVIATPPAPLTASKASFFMNADENIASTLVATDYKDPQLVCYEDDEPIAIDRAYFNQGQNALYDPQTYEDGTTPTLVARGPSAVATRYIVRRLTPTECARLQGFADRWGDIDHKTELTDEEYRFWLEVRNTHATINGKAVKDYDKKQMLTWYNKLPTDSAEYKLWGNGIALPTALYVVQGIADTTKGESK